MTVKLRHIRWLLYRFDTVIMGILLIGCCVCWYEMLLDRILRCDRIGFRLTSRVWDRLVHFDADKSKLTVSVVTATPMLDRWNMFVKQSVATQAERC